MKLVMLEIKFIKLKVVLYLYNDGFLKNIFIYIYLLN